MTGAGLPPSEILYARYACASPLRSPMFSPIVSLPLMCRSSMGLMASYWAPSFVVRASKADASSAVHRLAEPRDRIVVLKHARTHGVTHHVVTVDHQFRVIAWLVGITDLHREVRELFLRGSLGGWTHPLQAVDSNAVRVDEVL